MKGILADVNSIGLVESLVRRMRAEPWIGFWEFLGLELFHFDEVGLTPTSSDFEIWRKCQEDQLILITATGVPIVLIRSKKRSN